MFGEPRLAALLRFASSVTFLDKLLTTASALQLSVTKEMRFECSSKLSECNVRLSQLGWQTVPYAWLVA